MISTDMKKLRSLLLGVGAVVLALALAAMTTQPAAAQSDAQTAGLKDDSPKIVTQICTAEDLKGAFGFFAEGALNLPAIPLLSGPFSHVGRIVFDGVSVHKSETWVSYNGLVLEEPIEGPYRVNPDCSVSFIANLPPPVGLPVPFRAFLTADLQGLGIMPINPGSIVGGMKRKQGIRACTVADFSGSFLLQLSGLVVQPPPLAGRTARTGRLTADGAGNFAAVTSVSYEGLVGEENFAGTYTLNSDCILSLRTRSGDVKAPALWWGPLIDGGDGAYLIQREPPGTTIQGALTRLSRVAPIVPRIASAGVVNAASSVEGVVPGGLATIYGDGISQAVAGSATVGGSTSYRGTSVTIGGRAAPLLAISNQSGQEQINLQVPFEVRPGTTPVQVEVNNLKSNLADVTVRPSQPGIFEIALSGGGKVGAVLHLSGELVTPQNAARRGEILSLFLTGAGLLMPTVATGAAGPVPPATLALPVVVGVANISAPVRFSGYAPGFIGLYQVNFEVPLSAPTGSSVDLNVRVGEASSQTVPLAVQ